MAAQWPRAPVSEESLCRRHHRGMTDTAVAYLSTLKIPDFPPWYFPGGVCKALDKISLSHTQVARFLNSFYVFLSRTTIKSSQ